MQAQPTCQISFQNPVIIFINIMWTLSNEHVMNERRPGRPSFINQSEISFIHSFVYPTACLEALSVTARCWDTKIKTVMDGVPASINIKRQK